MLIRPTAVALVALAALCGCATTTPGISEAERKAIRTVSVARQVELAPHPQVIGPAASTATFAFGPLGALMYMNENSDSVQFKRHLDENKIDVREIVRDEFVAQLTNT